MAISLKPKSEWAAPRLRYFPWLLSRSGRTSKALLWPPASSLTASAITLSLMISLRPHRAPCCLLSTTCVLLSEDLCASCTSQIAQLLPYSCRLNQQDLPGPLSIKVSPSLSTSSSNPVSKFSNSNPALFVFISSYHHMGYTSIYSYC